MKISQQETKDRTLIITAEVTPEDYRKPVDEALKKYRRSAQMPGFRPGMVPPSMIKKMYGKSILMEELNSLLSGALDKFITDNQILSIGTPLPLPSEKEQVFEEGQSFEFKYEVGLMPDFEFSVSEKDVLPYYLIQVDDKMTEDEIADIRRRHGKFSNPEVSEEDNILYGDFEELDEQGNVKAEGNKTTTTLALEMIKDVAEKSRFVGLKKEDSVVFNPMNVLNNEAEVAAMLKVDKQAPAMTSDYKFTVKTINRLEKAELNQELFDKALGVGVANNEEEFRSKIRERIAKYFEYDSDRKLKKDLKNYLLESTSLPLPEEFLKRLLENAMEKKVDEHAFEHEFYHFNEDLRWDLIKQKVNSEHKFVVTEEEIKTLAANLVRSQFARYGIYDVADIRLDELAEDYMKKDDNRSSLERTLLEEKVFTYLKSKIHLNMIPLSYEEFMSKMLEKTSHEMEHHH